jgi:hypothetical protein
VTVDAIEVVSSYLVETTTIPSAIFSMTGLTSLTLVGSGEVNGLASLTNLKTLSMPYPDDFTGGDVQPLSTALTSLNMLENLEYTPSDDQTYSLDLAEKWKDTLKEATLSSGSLVDFIMKLTKLTHLKITQVADTGSFPANFGSQLPALEYFALTDTDLVMPSNAFVGNTALTRVELQQLRTTSPLPSSIWELDTLTALSLAWMDAVTGMPSTISK